MELFLYILIFHFIFGLIMSIPIRYITDKYEYDYYPDILVPCLIIGYFVVIPFLLTLFYNYRERLQDEFFKIIKNETITNIPDKYNILKVSSYVLKTGEGFYSWEDFGSTIKLKNFQSNKLYIISEKGSRHNRIMLTKTDNNEIFAFKIPIEDYDKIKIFMDNFWKLYRKMGSYEKVFKFLSL